jgi:hypothetical protein
MKRFAIQKKLCSSHCVLQHQSGQAHPLLSLVRNHFRKPLYNLSPCRPCNSDEPHWRRCREFFLLAGGIAGGLKDTDVINVSDESLDRSCFCNNRDPEWVTYFTCDIRFRNSQPLMFRVYDVDNGNGVPTSSAKLNWSCATSFDAQMRLKSSSSISQRRNFRGTLIIRPRTGREIAPRSSGGSVPRCSRMTRSS